MPAQAGAHKRRTARVLRGLAMALFVLLAASARARIVAADLVVVDHLFLDRAGCVAPDQLQLGQFPVLLSLDVSRKILDRGLRGQPLCLAWPLLLFLFFLVLVLLGKRQR